MNGLPPILETRQLTVRYGVVEAVSSISFKVERGSVVSVMGPNGAGKTTTLEALMGILPSSGQVLHDGVDIQGLTVSDRVRRGIALVPETRDLFADMSVEENLLLGAFNRYRSGERHFDLDLQNTFEIFPRLRERRSQLAGTLSGGERQMLAIGRALMSKPKLLMLDEPSLGLAPRIVSEIFAVITQMKQSGVSILLVEQNARAALAISDYGYVLETGSFVQQGTSNELASDDRLSRAYLGLESERT